MPTVTNEVLAVIAGSDLTFQDCFVLDTPIVIAQLRARHEAILSDVSISFPAGHNTKVIWSACNPTLAVLATDFGVFLTADGFITYNEIKIPEDLVPPSSRNQLKDLAMDNQEIIVLVDNLVLKILEYMVYSLQDLGIPEIGVTGVAGRTWCASTYPVEVSILKNCFMFYLKRSIHKL